MAKQLYYNTIQPKSSKIYLLKCTILLLYSMWNLIWQFDNLQANRQINIRQYEFSKYYKPWCYIISSN